MWRKQDEIDWIMPYGQKDFVTFQRDKSTISRHIKNIFAEGELNRGSVVAKFATTALDGKNY